MSYKKLITAVLFFSSGFANASSVEDLNIKLRNTGVENCTLNKIIHICGHLKKKSTVPSVLTADGKVKKFIVSGASCGWHESNTVINYSCGDNKKLVIQVNSGIKNNQGNQGFVKYTIYPETKDVFASVKILRQPFYSFHVVGGEKEHGGSILIKLTH